MNLNYSLRSAAQSDIPDMLEVFNFFVHHSYASYSEIELEPEFFHQLWECALAIIVLEINHKIVGFAYIKPYLAYKNCQLTGVLTYYILPLYTGKGFGAMMLDKLIEAARNVGMKHLLAHISSRNEQSLRFHRNHRFVECGRFNDIGTKFGHTFDVVWMQRALEP